MVADDVVTCPRGHGGHGGHGGRVVRDGIQRKGGRERQRWRCISVNGSYHRFLGVLSRTRATDETCVECENHIAPHQGPAAPAASEYLVREIAGALVGIGRGATYKDAARRVRARANIGKLGPWHDVTNVQTVAEWMADFAPVVAARHATTEWPAVLVLDSTPFRWTDPLTRKIMPLYWILAAYGYDKDGRNGRLWRLEATPASGVTAWTKFLASLQGRPDSIVCDSDNTIRAGVDKHWGKGAAVNLVHLCEHHLGANVRDALKSDGVPSGDQIHHLLQGAFTSPEIWDPFTAEVRRRPGLQLTNKWLSRVEVWVGTQIRVRHQIPPIYSNGAVEVALLDIRQTIAPRAFTFRNRGRLNQLLELIRLSHLRVDNATDYATDLRTHLLGHNGPPVRTYRDAYDSAVDDNPEGFCSLWSKTTQLAMKEARIRRSKI